MKLAKSLSTAVIWVASLFVVPLANAEDIDIFSGSNATSDLPNVILILDNSANWSTNLSVPDCYYNEGGVASAVGPKASNPNKEQGKKVAIQKCALYNVIDTLPVKTDGSAMFNIAIMLLNESPASNAGGYPRKAFTELSTTNKAALKTVIKNLAIDDDKGNNASFAKALYEAYLYYAAAAPYKGNAGTKWDSAAFAAGKYVSPSVASCGRNYVILIANGSPESSENNDSLALLTAKGANTTQITYPSGYVSNPDQANWADEMARFMAGQDVSSKDDAQTITTYTISITGASSDGLYPNFLNGVARAGGGDGFQASNVTDLTKRLNDIFNQIQAVNSVFASASLPASVSARGSYLNQVYMGVFRPDADAHPRWRGNLKQYRFSYNAASDSLSLTDSAGVSAVSSVTGFISPSAVSYWTSASTFWVNEPLGTPKTASDSPDGEVVEKGGVAQRIRTVHDLSQSARNMFTCISCAAGSNLTATAQKFDSTNAAITFGALATTSTDRANLIDWVRGTDNVPANEKGPGAPTTIRPSVHGDVLHSRPLALNFTTGVVVFYGSNDGALRAVNGDQTGTNAGQELWSFIPEENFSKLKRLRDNAPEIRLSTTPVSAVSATPRDYFVDGPIAAYQKLNSDNTINTAHLFFGMRRGGRYVYSLDVTSPTAPTFRWKVGPTMTVDAVTYQLGQTWSEPKVANVKVAGVSTRVIIMGGGYDAAAEDASTPGSTSMGNAVLVIDAITGELLKAFPTTRSVPADVTLIDSDTDGLVDRVYAIDMGGNLYRIDLGTVANSAITNWGMFRLASLSGSGTRKFFFAPDVVLTSTFAAIMIGSGDREKPLNTTVAGADSFMTVYDNLLSRGTPATAPTAILSSDLGLVGSSESMTAGCYIPMGASEKIVNAPLTAGGTTYFGTNTPTPPAANSCASNLGLAKVYAVPAFCQTPISSNLVGGGLPPSPVSGTVTVSYTLPDGGTATKDMQFVIGAPNPKNSAIEVSKLASTPTVSSKKRRLYRYLEGIR